MKISRHAIEPILRTHSVTGAALALGMAPSEVKQWRHVCNIRHRLHYAHRVTTRHSVAQIQRILREKRSNADAALLLGCSCETVSRLRKKYHLDSRRHESREHTILYALCMADTPLSIRALAERTGISSPGVSYLLPRLQARGLIQDLRQAPKSGRQAQWVLVQSQAPVPAKGD